MRAGRSLLLALAAIGAARAAHAGEIVRFEAGAQGTAEVVLPHVPVKAVVAEFLDPADTGAGKSIGYLIWRELLTAVSDQAGAGVILARAPGERRLSDLLEEEYHQAAVRIGRQQGASMTLWGAVTAVGDDLEVSVYLSLLPEAADPQFKFRLSGEPPLPPGLEGEITRRNFNFPPTEATRAQLFDRTVVTRGLVAVHARADASARQVAQAPKGTALHAVDMEKGWFKVEVNGRSGFVDNSAVDVPPRTVEASSLSTWLLSAPGGQRIRKVLLDGSYRVMNMRYVSDKGLWYELQVGTVRGWVPAASVRARFSLPAVHFVAALYRYQFKRYEDVRRELGQYIRVPESAGDNPSLATAYQLLGASTMAMQRAVYSVDASTVEQFSKAVAATPYDAHAYVLRALSILALRREAGLALTDLEEALRLDPDDSGAVRVTHTLYSELSVTKHGMLQDFLRDGRSASVQRKLAELVQRYPEQTKAPSP